MERHQTWPKNSSQNNNYTTTGRGTATMGSYRKEWGGYKGAWPRVQESTCQGVRADIANTIESVKANIHQRQLVTNNNHQIPPARRQSGELYSISEQTKCIGNFFPMSSNAQEVMKIQMRKLTESLQGTEQLGVAEKGGLSRQPV